jgi:hypothetical protein
VVREWFAVISQNINTTSAFVLALFTRRSYRRTAARRAAAKQAAWHRWWQSAQGTFNALIEQEFGAGATNGSQGDTGNGELRKDQQRRGQQGRHDDDGEDGGRPGSLRVAPSPRVPPAQPPLQKSSRWRLWGRRGAGRGGGSALEEACAPFGPDLLRRGSALFELPSGYAVADMVARRGLLEDLRVGAEAGIDRAFGAVRRTLRRMLGLDGGEEGPGGAARRRGPASADSPGELLARSMRRRTPPSALPPLPEDGGAQQAAAADVAEARTPRRAARRPPLRSLLRSGRHWGEDLSVWTASDVILREGYPLEQHSVTTAGGCPLLPARPAARRGQTPPCCPALLYPRRRCPAPLLSCSRFHAHPSPSTRPPPRPADGYVLQVHRMPRHGARDVALFQHGVLDTSLGWVANGVQGSAAFAAWDAGFDVWLGNSRSNAPRLHRGGRSRRRCLALGGQLGGAARQASRPSSGACSARPPAGVTVLQPLRPCVPPPPTHTPDPERQGSRYWCYSMNELGQDDIAAGGCRARWQRQAPPGGGSSLPGPSERASAAVLCPVLCHEVGFVTAPPCAATL